MLTDKQIQKAIRTLTAETTLNDGAQGRGTGSLQLRLRPTAKGVSATWLGFWKVNGKRFKKQLGRYPELSLAEARDKFDEEVKQVLSAGRNPRAVVASADKPTVQALFEAYVKSLEENGSRSVVEIERILLTGRYAAAEALGRDTLASDVLPEDVSAFLAQGFARGARRQTDICRTYMAAAFSWAIKSTHDYKVENRRDWKVRQNPVAAIPRDTEANKTRDRNLSAEEMKAVWYNAPDQTGDVMRLVMACGQRVLETMRVAGSEIDLEARLWTMPAEKTKGGKRPHTVPLPRQAVEIFTRLKEQHGNGLLFPSPTLPGQHITVAAVSRGAARLTCCESFQPRDLRRTWKSRAHDAGIDRFTRDLIQQHAQNDTGTKHYDRAEYLPQMREAMDKWERWLDKALKLDQPDQLAA